jgi:hypothetical protein
MSLDIRLPPLIGRVSSRCDRSNNGQPKHAFRDGVGRYHCCPPTTLASNHKKKPRQSGASDNDWRGSSLDRFGRHVCSTKATGSRHLNMESAFGRLVGEAWELWLDKAEAGNAGHA